MNRIVCVGNPYVPEDSAGARVFDRLSENGPVDGLEVVFGGTAGLNLLSMTEGCGRVVFVDTIQGFTAPGGVLLLDADDAARCEATSSYHGAGLSALLRMLPKVSDGPVPELLVLGIEPPAGEATIRRAAELGITLALEGRRPAGEARGEGRHQGGGA